MIMTFNLVDAEHRISFDMRNLYMILAPSLDVFISLYTLHYYRVIVICKKSSNLVKNIPFPDPREGFKSQCIFKA